MTKFEIEEKIVAMLKTVYDPEIPVNVYDLGLIYKIDVTDDFNVSIDMTLTAPNCPAADFIMEDIRQKIESIEGVAGYPPKDREHRRCGLGHHQPGLRTRMGQGHDERGG